MGQKNYWIESPKNRLKCTWNWKSQIFRCTVFPKRKIFGYSFIGLFYPVLTQGKISWCLSGFQWNTLYKGVWLPNGIKWLQREKCADQLELDGLARWLWPDLPSPLTARGTETKTNHNQTLESRNSVGKINTSAKTSCICLWYSRVLAFCKGFFIK